MLFSLQLSFLKPFDRLGYFRKTITYISINFIDAVFFNFVLIEPSGRSFTRSSIKTRLVSSHTSC